MVSSSETANTLLIGAIGIIVPQIVQNWATFLLTIASFVWVVYQIIRAIREDVKKNKEKK
jgi:hypothetical protein